ncbi:ABC transporter substrate-binding protein [Bacillus sp. CECT 9360]|uniref:ABC transporter substrate-binding protein n=1 Tax=Bacillus sp. CECT 9360 TaxID=2845821 RepID=UPI001E4C5594|nr:ABC transporter substrate-binding protein [Bacillus sp. CECT 9360]CAH0344264.1 Formylaminopyrimidine-binding protein [Bacillus sp. CECT 9360]
MEKISVGLEWFMNPDHIPMMIGVTKGWFMEEGLEINMIEPKEHFDAIDEIKAGNMDIAITEPIHLVEDRANDHSIVGFSRFLHTNGGVMYMKGKGINRPIDLIGKRIQYPGAPGLGGLSIVKTMVEADGGTCRLEDFQPINNGFYHTDALKKDKADAATLIFRNFEMIEAKHKGLDAGFFSLRNWGVPDFCQLIFITSPEILNRRQNAIEKFIKVIRRSIDFMYENPEETKNIYIDFTNADRNDPLTAETTAATIPCFTFDFSMTAEYYDRLQNWMKESGKIDQMIDPQEYWTNRFCF